MFSIKKSVKKYVLLCVISIMCLITVPCYAKEDVNPSTGYTIGIYDDADILTSSEEELLMEQMEPISEYGHVALVTIDYNPYNDTERYCNYFYDEYFGRESGTVFIIDMQERYLYILNDGYIQRIITNSYSLTITDNVYTYATDGDYYLCASKAFSQINTLLEGGRISQPMKYICNALLALIIGFTITYVIVRIAHSRRVAKSEDILNAIYAQTHIHNPRSIFLTQTRRYDPPSSSRSGGGGGGGGGGRSGGGHSF